jgi:oligopeptidase A
MNPIANPLLDRSFPIPFARIRHEHVVPGIRTILEDARARVERIASDDRPPTWDSVLAPFEDMIEQVARTTTPVQHLLAVAETPELRKAWGEVLPDLTKFWSWVHLHRGLWERLKALDESAEAERLDPLRNRHLKRTVRDFRREGADLGKEDRERLEEIEVLLAQLRQTFSENVLDATASFSLLIKDPERLRGIPDDALNRFRQSALEAGEDGWQITLDGPAVQAVLQRAEDRELRAEIHRAYHARGKAEPTDNRPLIRRILQLRREKARLLGYADFPDYRLEEQMVKSGSKALEFVSEVTERTRPYWERDLRELTDYADTLGLGSLEPWDVGFLIESLKRERFDLDQEALRPYFSLELVQKGLSDIVERLFGLRVEPRDIEEVWHEDVRYFELFDRESRLLGGFYTDFFPRPEKRGGAWMNDLAYGGPMPDGSFAPHFAVICANFPPPDGDRPALLTHRDVETLFHEFGHLLHHLCSEVPVARRGGVSVARDWVELPSQLLQNWAWERDPLDLFARHWKTEEPLPDTLFRRLLDARRFMGGWRQMRQLGFGTLDLALHSEFDGDRDSDPVEWVTDLLEPISPSRRFAETHPLPAFLHIFSGGYAASYYSYLWAEVLEADMFSRFLRSGIFDQDTGREYLRTILSAGDRTDPELLFRSFMGRDPDPEALIARNLG